MIFLPREEAAMEYWNRLSVLIIKYRLEKCCLNAEFKDILPWI